MNSVNEEIKKPTVTFEELAISNMYEIEALIRVLVKKKIITTDEVLQEIKIVQKEHHERRKNIGQA